MASVTLVTLHLEAFTRTSLTHSTWRDRLLSFILGRSPSADPVVLRKAAFVALLQALLCRCNTVGSRLTTQARADGQRKTIRTENFEPPTKKKLGPQEHNMTQPVGHLCSRIAIDSPASPLRGVSFFSRIPRLLKGRHR
jgi:hypothetical protein